MTCRLFPIVAAALGLGLGVAHSFGQLLSTYQGVLQSEGQPYTGTADVRFALFDPENDRVWGPFSVSNVNVVDGVFTTQIPIGNRVTGPGFTLDVAVRTPSDSGDFVTLSPRQPITVAPFAGRAAFADHASAAGSADAALVANTANLAQNTRGLAVNHLGDVGIRNTSPERVLHLGSPSLGSESLIRISSSATSTPAARTWDIGVPRQETLPLSGAAYNFVINDVGSGRDPLTDPMFTVQFATGRVGINTPNPTSMLQVNGEARASTLRADTEARAATVVATSNVQTPEVRFSDGTTQATAFRMFRIQRSISVGLLSVGQTQQYSVSFPTTIPVFTGNETAIINVVSTGFRQGLILGAPTIAPGSREVRFSTLSEITLDYGNVTVNVTVIP